MSTIVLSHVTIARCFFCFLLLFHMYVCCLFFAAALVNKDLYIIGLCLCHRQLQRSVMSLVHVVDIHPSSSTYNGV